MPEHTPSTNHRPVRAGIDVRAWHLVAALSIPHPDPSPLDSCPEHAHTASPNPPDAPNDAVYGGLVCFWVWFVYGFVDLLIIQFSRPVGVITRGFLLPPLSPPSLGDWHYVVRECELGLSPATSRLVV